MTQLYSPLPNKKYDIIYADPPWAYRDVEFVIDGETSSVEDHYPTLKLPQLKELPVWDIAKKDCLLFMWSTGPKLDEAIPLLTSWKFKYATVGFVWNKVLCHPGYYTLGSTEYVLIGKRGKIPQPRGARNIRQFLELKRTKHSKKPIEIAERIDQMFPTQSKIELFARSKYKDWDVWGNQAPVE